MRRLPHQLRLAEAGRGDRVEGCLDVPIIES